MPVTIVDSTVYLADYVVGDSLTVTVTRATGAGGPYTWTIGFLDPDKVGLDSGDTPQKTGTSVTFDVVVAGTGAPRFIVEIEDAAGGPAYAYDLVSLNVIARVTPTRTAAGTLDVADLDLFTPCNAAGGGFTLTMTVSASERKYATFPVGNVGGANNVVIAPLAGETIEGGASITLAPGQRVILRSDNLNNWYKAGAA